MWRIYLFIYRYTERLQSIQENLSKTMQSFYTYHSMLKIFNLHKVIIVSSGMRSIIDMMTKFFLCQFRQNNGKYYTSIFLFYVI